MFSLFADRVEQFVQSELRAHLSPAGRAAVRVAGLFLPMLLFADDLVLLGTDVGVV